MEFDAERIFSRWSDFLQQNHILSIIKTKYDHKEKNTMAGKERDPEVLRAEAKELLNKAKKIEEKKFKGFPLKPGQFLS
jgi:hypothetical protein